MDTLLLKRKFEALGARLKVGPIVASHRSVPNALTLDIRRDDAGEYFELRLDDKQVEHVDAIQVKPRERHLLLLAWTQPYNTSEPTFPRMRRWNEPFVMPPLSKEVQKPRFLCGHDERHWFVAAIPEEAHASTVRTAMEALKPREVVDAQARRAIPFAQQVARKNRAFRRQGEWFFLPQPKLTVAASMVRRNEPLQRSGGKPHWAEFAYREGGEPVYVSTAFPAGLTAVQYHQHVARRPQDRGRFRMMLRNAQLYVRGRITHPDHAAIVLNGWHAVVMNTEHRAAARQNVVFLD